MSYEQTTKRRSTAKTALCISIAAAMIAASLPFMPHGIAYAETEEELVERVNSTSAEYDAAVAEQESIAASISEIEGKIAALEEQMPSKRNAMDAAARSLYENGEANGPGTLVSLLTSADDISQVLETSKMLDRMAARNADDLTGLADSVSVLNASKAELDEQKAKADEAVASAKSAMDEAIAARQSMQKAQQTRANQEALGGQSADLADDVDWNMTKDAFVAEWSSRIDAYLAGSPTAGTGAYYATAAWENGVDPRWAPAISLVESTKGAVCFRSHNAWGYGGKNYSSWEEGINAVVSGLGGSLYGGVLTEKAARTYCPPNWQHWFSTCYSEMKKI